MGTTYTLDSIDSVWSAGTYNKNLVTAGPTPGSLVVNAPAATAPSLQGTSTAVNVANFNTYTNITVNVKITSGNANLFGSVYAVHADSSGSFIAQTSGTPEQQFNTGQFQFNFSIAALGTWNIGDLLSVLIYFRNADGGASHSATVELGTANATVVVFPIFQVSRTEAATATEAESAAGTYPAASTEAATATEVENAAGTFPASRTESATATEISNALFLKTADITEAATATDVENATITFAVSRTEVATATETESAAAAMVASRTEAVSATESENTIAAFAASRTEAATAVDAQSAAAAMVSSRTEIATAVDDIDGDINVFFVTIGESAPATESQSAVAAFVASMTESAPAIDISIGGSALQLDITEAASATDEQSDARFVFSEIVEVAFPTESESATQEFSPRNPEGRFAIVWPNRPTLGSRIEMNKIATLIMQAGEPIPDDVTLKLALRPPNGEWSVFESHYLYSGRSPVQTPYGQLLPGTFAMYNFANGELHKKGRWQTYLVFGKESSLVGEFTVE